MIKVHQNDACKDFFFFVKGRNYHKREKVHKILFFKAENAIMFTNFDLIFFQSIPKDCMQLK